MRSRNSKSITIGIVAALAALFLAGPAHAERRGKRAKPAKSDDRAVVAVLYFDNNTGDRAYDVLQKGLADMLVTDLASVDVIEVVERDKLEEILGELKRQSSRYFDPKTAQKIGRLIGARYAITGAFAALSPTMRIDIRLVDVQTARVVMADKVVGDKDRFFDLQQALVAKFVAGLQVRGGAAKRAARTASRVDRVDVLLTYSQGIDQADRGDLKGASVKLAQVVRAAPKFALAKQRYTDILRRLKLAGQRRERALGDTEGELLRNIEAALAVPIERVTGERDARRRLSYRIARGQHLVWALNQLAVEPKSGRRTAWIPAGDRKAARVHAVAFLANCKLLIRELAAVRAKGWRMSFGVDPEDRVRGIELGISSRMGEWSFAAPQVVAREAAQWALLGEAPYWGNTVRGTVRPALIELDRRAQKQVFALLAFARRDIRAHERRNQQAREMAIVINTHAEGLVRLGRMEDAIAVWQEYLDAYPKGEKYREFEGKIEALLGVSAKAQAFAAALPACGGDLAAMAHEEVGRVRRAGGAAGVDRLVGEAFKACAGDQTKLGTMLTVAYLAAQDAVENGECKRFGKILARARRAATNPAFTDNIAKLGADCPAAGP